MSIFDGFNKNNSGTLDSKKAEERKDYVSPPLFGSDSAYDIVREPAPTTTREASRKKPEEKIPEPVRVNSGKVHVSKDRPKKKGLLGKVFGGDEPDKVVTTQGAAVVGVVSGGAQPQEVGSGTAIVGEQPLSGWSFDKTTSYIYRPLENKTLHIILIENSEETNKLNEVISKLVANSVKVDQKGLTCIVNYGGTVHFTEPMNIFDAQKLPALVESDMGESACLFDALFALNNLIKAKKKSIEDDKTRRVRINVVDILGIGTCKDIGSTHSKEEAIAAFDEIFKESTVTTRYFCLTEDGLLDAAEFGFKSIGSISRNYQ